MSDNTSPTLRDVLARIPKGSARSADGRPARQEARNLAWAARRAAAHGPAGLDSDARSAILAARARVAPSYRKLAQALRRLTSLAD